MVLHCGLQITSTQPLRFNKRVTLTFKRKNKASRQSNETAALQVLRRQRKGASFISRTGKQRSSPKNLRTGLNYWRGTLYGLAACNCCCCCCCCTSHVSTAPSGPTTAFSVEPGFEGDVSAEAGCCCCSCALKPSSSSTSDGTPSIIASNVGAPPSRARLPPPPARRGGAEEAACTSARAGRIADWRRGLSRRCGNCVNTSKM